MSWTDVAWIVGSGLATAIGGLFLLVLGKPDERWLDILIGFTAGVMLAAAIFSLIIPALERGSLIEVVGGLAIGSAFLVLLDLVIPHVHLRFTERGRRQEKEKRKQAALLLSALAIHNIPEGMAVGVAFAAGGAKLGIPIALAIGIQNVPEGFAAAAPLLGTGTSRSQAALVAAGTGVVEPPTAFAALAAFGLAKTLLPLGLAFAAGAMIYVVVDELIPESHSKGNELWSSIALLVGFAVMLVLDNAFG